MTHPIQKAVVVAGGKGTRLEDLKFDLNKHCLPVYDKPMIEHVIQTLVQSGIKEILVLLNWRYPETIMTILEDGSRFGCDIYYRYLRECHGPGRELFLAREWVGTDEFLLITGDSLYVEPLNLHGVQSPHMWVMPLDDEFDDLSKYSSVVVEDGFVEAFIKNGSTTSGLIQTGAWVFHPRIFATVFRLNQENREIRIRDIVEAVMESETITCTILPPHSFIDLGTPEALLTGAKMLELLDS